MELEVRHLRFLDAIASAGSLTRAAIALGLSQPALTAQVNRVEHHLRGRVFDRGRHGARPTELGEIVLHHAADVLTALNDLDVAVQLYHTAAETNVLRIGVRSSMVIADLLDDVAAEVFDDRPVKTAATDRPTALTALAEGRLDLVLETEYPGRELAVPHGLGWCLVGAEPIFAIVSPEHPSAAHGQIDLAALADSTWLSANSVDDEFARHLSQRYEAAGLTPVPIQPVAPAMLRQLLRRDPRAVAAAQALHSGAPIPGVLVALRGTPLRCRHFLLWREDSAMTARETESVRGGLVAAYNGLAKTGYRMPEWLAAHPGWLGNII
ncbi:LysR family transcriptional regulator [Amycolatopsis azurea]|uniref:LysR family transcriptional regulator n=1 Tax=Amycolatopsis azurea TaxID=36819 RepID=UPI0037F11344